MSRPVPRPTQPTTEQLATAVPIVDEQFRRDVEESMKAEPERVGILLSDVRPEPVEWIWPGRIARGKVTVIDGDPGRGKSVLTLDMASRITTGRPWPDDLPCLRGGVVLLSAEDGLADTI